MFNFAIIVFKIISDEDKIIKQVNFEYTTMILWRTLLRILLAILINLSLRSIEVEEMLPKKELTTDQNKMKSSVSRSLQLAT